MTMKLGRGLLAGALVVASGCGLDDGDDGPSRGPGGAGGAVTEEGGSPQSSGAAGGSAGASHGGAPGSDVNAGAAGAEAGPQPTSTSGAGGELSGPVCSGCLITGHCYEDGIGNPDRPCQVCDVAMASDTWTPRADGAPCDDGQFCNGPETCLDGSCSQHAGDPCDDGIACNGAERCDEAAVTVCMPAGRSGSAGMGVMSVTTGAASCVGGA